MEEKMHRFLLGLVAVVLVIVGCTNNDDEGNASSGGGTAGKGTGNSASSDDCNPIGAWKATLTTGSGDCFDEGITENLDVDLDQSDMADIDKAKCQYEKSGPFHQDESDEAYEMDGTLTLTITFDGDELSGTGKLTAELLESGVSVSSCEQSYTVAGSR
jgi:hypothetical protein